ncbi:MAG: hypothetical protein A4E57_03515 [Syntrophorhabdaceae bacterium PtaU1.Bin034]|nr:MAG: hypothetical protein A4E57_03515 [Syntrophorhabdaceae bacterium PtaU1.Bin034]
MDLKGFFTHDSVHNIEGIGKEWGNLREHDLPYARRYRNRHRENEKGGEMPGHRKDPPPAPPPPQRQTDQDQPAAKDGSGFEIVI